MSDLPISASEMTPLQKQQHENNIKNFNRGLNHGRGLQQTLGKDSFLKILTEQLKQQDPLKPMEDKDFIAQMAQFNSLEQMMELNKSFEMLTQQYGNTQAIGLLGKQVTINSGLDRDGNPIIVSGSVSAIDQRSGAAKIKVNGNEYGVDQIVQISMPGQDL